jgi:hypothetical protein
MPNNIMPGEHDWMYGIPGMIDPGVDPRMGFPGKPAQTNFMSKLTAALGGPQGLLNLGANLMAAGGPSPQRTNLGQALGGSLLANQQFQQQQGDNQLKQMLLMSQIQKAKQQQQQKAMNVGAGGSIVDPTTGKVIYQNPAKTGERPNAIEEFEYYKNLPTDEERNAYLTVKRSMQPFQLGELGGGKVVFNRATGQYEQATTAEQEGAAAAQLASGTAAGRTTGEAVATAKLDLPRLEQNTQQALQTIDQLKKHPGLPYITGLYSAAPIIPGTPQADADALAKQIQGKTFLEAFTTLKGGGAITEVEGGKAEAAIARLQRSQTRREYIKALEELESVMNVGLERARRKAQAGPSAPRSREDILKQYGVQ